MAYHHFDDVQEAARFIADIGFSIAGTSQGDFTSDHVKYHCNLSMGDSAFGTSFQSNPQYHDEPTVVDVLSSLCLDASSVDGVHIDDFADEMDFKKPSEAIRAYEGCKKALDWLKDGLGLDGEDIAQLGQTLDENEEEVKEAVTAIRDERAAEQERTHPEVPEGFVSIESLQAGLDLGDYGDQLTEYEGYITDAIQECADSNIDIYYHDLLKWLPDNYEWIEEAEAAGLLLYVYLLHLQDDADGAVRMLLAGHVRPSGRHLQELRPRIPQGRGRLRRLRQGGRRPRYHRLRERQRFEELTGEAVDLINNAMDEDIVAGVFDELAPSFYTVGDDLVDDYNTIRDANGFNFPNHCAMSADVVREVNRNGLEAAIPRFLEARGHRGRRGRTGHPLCRRPAAPVLQGYRAGMPRLRLRLEQAAPAMTSLRGAQTARSTDTGRKRAGGCGPPAAL